MGGLKMRTLVCASVLALSALNGSGCSDDPKEAPGEDFLFPLPPQEVATGKFEQWHREATKKPSSVTYTRVAYWVVEAFASGYGDPPKKIAVYAPTKGGSFRR